VWTLAGGGAVWGQADPAVSPPGVALERLEILSGGRRHLFQVELADSSDERAKGLMYRRHLPAGQGMLFDFEHDKLIMMWMKNTFISLDMIFIAGNGRIIHIARNTKPLSLAVIESGGPVRAVLEVIAGTARRLGLKTGDRVRHRIFNQR